LTYRAEVLESKTSKLLGNTINGKNIVVFGDSLTEFKDVANNKAWPTYASELSGANFINVAIGGTQLRQRSSRRMLLFSESITCEVDDWVFYKPNSTMNCYKCTTQHTGPWSSNDFEEITYSSELYAPLDIINMIVAATNTNVPIENRFDTQLAAARCIADHLNDYNVDQVNRLKNVDWSIIDAVVIVAGGNDYNHNHGSSGSTDINTTMGAINEIIRLLTSTYKELSIYYAANVVLWEGYTKGVGDPAKWMSVYVPPTGTTLTRAQFYDQLVEEFENNYIPCLSLYKTLGWTMYNFDEYFYTDGAHPTRGGGLFKVAKKIVSYLESSKSF
jgi:lysophospholipase L1-like esterase